MPGGSKPPLHVSGHEKASGRMSTYHRHNASPDRRENHMATDDTCCTIVPYFKVSAENLPAFKALCERFVAQTDEEVGCLYYGFSFDGEAAFCREGYVNADALLAHIENVGPLLEEAAEISKITRLEVHGPEAELARLREPMAALNPQFFALEYGFRR